MSDKRCGILNAHGPHPWGDLNWCPGTPAPVPSEADPGTGERECVGCPPCPGRGNDGHGMTHCAECCMGTGIEAEYGCPVHNPATPDAGDVEALAKVLAEHEPQQNPDATAYYRDFAAAVLASDWLASHDAATADRVRRETAEAQRCGGCKGQGSHRRHCPRHPNYHPWIPLADRAESIGDSIGDPGLANQAWALAGAIRAEMPNHPYRPVRPRDEADS